MVLKKQGTRKRSPVAGKSGATCVDLRRYGRVELQVRLQLLPTAIFAAAALELSGATTASLHDIAGAGTVPLHLACEPLRVSMVAHMLKPPQPSCLSATPSGFFRTWATLPARVEMSGKGRGLKGCGVHVWGKAGWGWKSES